MVIFPVYIHFFNPTLTPDAYIIFTSTFNFIPFYAVVLPIVLFWRHETLRKSLKTVIGKNNRILPAPIDRNDGRTEEQIVHFEALRIMWTPKVYDSEIKSSRKRQPIEDNIHSISASFA
uniref:Uncharacterized protein n=1 Tax=Plectus sambesii TaxID=2011161 RepID=A0A914WTY4_9BILA